jgi:hypothetical protein
VKADLIWRCGYIRKWFQPQEPEVVFFVLQPALAAACAVHCDKQA